MSKRGTSIYVDFDDFKYKGKIKSWRFSRICHILSRCL